LKNSFMAAFTQCLCILTTVFRKPYYC